ncbi:hypothetical protein PT974_08733 [Cladobotryum mycophilum]|uniref:Uncharacterized protein n=1 Tax=Cladobotryum mycophilum TaxID=491253 RepID=A0ABR0SF83_9HYPO
MAWMSARLGSLVLGSQQGTWDEGSQSKPQSQTGPSQWKCALKKDDEGEEEEEKEEEEERKCGNAPTLPCATYLAGPACERAKVF